MEKCKQRVEQLASVITAHWTDPAQTLADAIPCLPETHPTRLHLFRILRSRKDKKTEQVLQALCNVHPELTVAIK